ncbi:hypothetical protein BKA62DRAFT_770145 [Auriculariales sp. MPI-PUGE-AT-0066]|nr:hypothetical protein BKA62DRAFT_770145 [Auriculariales sp. MPI-PUGE-AT-0066]
MSQWNRSVRERTQNYVYEDSTVWLEVDKTKFRVSRRKLTSVSPLFETIFDLPKQEDEEEQPIVLHHSVSDFENFLWYLHTDHLEFENYKAQCPKEERFRHALSIASIAHFYQATDIARWAIAELLALLPSSNIKEHDILTGIHSFSTRALDIEPQLLRKVQEYWCQQVTTSTDPVLWLRAARSAQDQYLQAYAYYYILKLKNLALRSDPRLSTIDKLRLQCGAVNLLRFQGQSCSCTNVLNNGHTCGRTVDPDEWTAATSVALKDFYGSWSLWDMFTRSAMGLELADESALIKKLGEDLNKTEST